MFVSYLRMFRRDFLIPRVQLGNYFGALSQWIEMQNESTKPRQLIYSVVGLHALTMPQNAKQLQKNRLNTLASILAVGVNPEKAILFFQEDVRSYEEIYNHYPTV